MSRWCGTITKCISPIDIPEKFESLLDIQALYEHGHDLATVSRNDWLGLQLSELVSLRNLRAIEYLTQPASVLQSAEIIKAVSAIEGLLAEWRSNPSAVLLLTGQSGYSQEAIARILDGEPCLVAPPEIDAEEGDSPLYLAWFLTAHLAILRSATNSGRFVVFAKSP